MATSLIDVIKGMFSGNSTDLKTLSQQYKELEAQLPLILQQRQQQPQQPQPQQQPAQPQKLLKQTKKTTSPETKTPQPAKKPLTAETLETVKESQSTVPMLPYTPQGIFELVNQGKLSPAQAQQMLGPLAEEELFLEKWLAQIKQNLETLPDEIKVQVEGARNDMQKVFNELKQNIEKQVEIHQKYADKKIEWVGKHLNWITQVFTDLIKEKPNLEPDKWTEFGRNLAMALGAISAMVHPHYAPYFYMAIPQVVQYWHNEDMRNFEKAMKKFELALKLAGTQLDFYNQIMQHNLAILDAQKEKELLPLIMTGQLLMENYRAHTDVYNKLSVEYAKSFSDKIAHSLTALKAGIQLRHHETLKKIKEFEAMIRLLELQEKERHNRIMEKLRQETAIRLGQKLDFTKMEKLHPWLFPKKLLEALNIQDPELAYRILVLYALHGPERAFHMLSELLSSGIPPTETGGKPAKSRFGIPYGEGAEDLPPWWVGW